MIQEKDPLHTFANLPPDIEMRLRALLHVHSFSAGDSIFVQGANAEAVYLVASGLVKVVRVTPEGYESVLCMRRAGDYFCPVPLLDKGSQLGTAVAITNVTLFSVERTAFNELCRESADLLAVVQGDCLGEVRRLLNRLETFAFRTIKERLAIALLREVKHQEAYTNASKELRLTQQDVAGLVGASRERVSRILKAFERSGVVTLKRGRIILLDIEYLQKLAKED
ncbi:MAG: Crp/Fnr family transcriptional regulator [Chloroflexi bacterium]|nr:Crp/Fnr family transcriptional regulator [Chloroflexota bacterium]